MTKTIVINLIAPPGTGKSTVAAELFAKMKWAGYQVELVSEYQKELIWDERSETFKDEVYLFAKQNHRMFRLKGKVKYIITDRPLILSILYNTVYGNGSTAFNNIVIEAIKDYHNLNVYLHRTKPYDTVGRNETESESNVLGERLYKMINDLKINYTELNAEPNMTSESILLKLLDFEENIKSKVNNELTKTHYRTLTKDEKQLKRLENEIRKIEEMLFNYEGSSRVKETFELQLESLKTLKENYGLG